MPSRTDLAVVATALGAGLLLFWIDFDRMWGPDQAAPTWVRVLLLVVACAGQLFRTARPGLALALAGPAVAVDLALGHSSVVLVVGVDVLFSTAVSAGPRLYRGLVTGIGLLCVGLTVGASLLTGEPRLALLVAVQAFSMAVVPVWWGSNIRQHRQNERQLARIAELDRRAAVTAERARMARDLHDVVAGHLSAIAIQSEAVLTLPDDDPERVRSVLRAVREGSVGALAEMRTMIDVLRADGEVDEAVSARLGEVGRLVEASGLDVRLRVDDVSGVPAAVDVAGYRIAQESLTNALKHGARGGRVSLRVERQAARVVLEVGNEVRDEGRAGRAPGSGTGLVGMAERAHAVGGRFRAGVEDGLWVVRAELPL
ncbi:two-component sensor histidine kinase [Actinosynnema pretiosum subsp. pretiosum]|uniref:histidine kinase n=1 Tax=Actinosynnema pretiosum subsp. pretiosum TaxID=103721 RepID=A0AA45LBC3_9PSEU|nr:putative two-component system sensor kinase [Actinosynnema pretiosum subsp. pretiosum]QUF06148.1 two-component sensor histidine kinase [Actinosynnema pretiosum subsp. pretiosum]